MSQKKSQKNPKFSKLRLRSAASVSKKTSSLHIDPREKISSYFSLTTGSQIESDELFDSAPETQYGQQLSSGSENTSVNDENDFSETKTVKPVKVFEIKVQNESKVMRKRARNKNNLNRFIKDLGPSCSDTNQEHLQLAIAMSKSLEDYENPGQNIEDNYNSPYPSTQQKITEIKKTLDQFGFKSDRSAVEFPPSKNNTRQKKKFKYLTPTLFLRTEEDRAKLIESKVSGILTNISVYNKNMQEMEEPQNDEFETNKPKSFILRDYYDEDSTLFAKINLNIDEINDLTYYNTIVPKVVVKTGVLLKDWHAIPGREKTPPINIIVEETEDILQETQNPGKEDEILEEEQSKETDKLEVTTMDRSISPELFSDNDSELSKTPPKNSLNHIENTNKNSQFTNKTPSPIILISSNSKNSPLLCEKEIFSDDSDAKSLSLLDNISPHRNKKSPKKNINKMSPVKKALFRNTTNSELLLDGITLINKNPSSIKSDSPIKTFEDSQICHYESFRDNSNDCFDLTKSSDDSNDIFNQDTIIQPLTSQVVDVPPISENLFSNDIDIEMGGHDNNFSQYVLKNNITVDLTQSSNDSKEMIPEKNKDDIITETESIFRDDYFERSSLWEENNILKSKSNENCNSLHEDKLIEDNSNESLKTVLLNHNSPNIVEDTEKVNLYLEENSINSVKTVLLKSPKSVEQIETNPVQKTILDNDDYSPEFDIINSSNNKEFYDSLNKSSPSVISDSESDNDEPIKKYLNTLEIKQNKSVSSNILNIQNKSSEINGLTTPKRRTKSFRKSFSENCIGSKEFNFVSDANKTEFFKLSSPLNITKFHTEPDGIQLPEEENFKFNLSDTEISDEELNYSTRKHINDISKSFNDSDLNKSLENPKDDLQYLSQSSVDTNSDISDEELNYSTNNSFRIRQLNKEIDAILNSQEKLEDNYMDFNDLPYTGFEPSSSNINKTLNCSETQAEILHHPRVQDLKTPTKFRRSLSESCVIPNDIKQSKITPNIKTPENNKNNSIIITPNNDYIIKTKDVTPMPNYQEMNSPQLRKELDKYGIKPLKRAKGIKILQYIYDATHPVLDQSAEKIRKSSSDDEDGRIIKRRKKNSTPKLIKQTENENVVACVGSEIAESESIKDMIFERKYSVRISSCRIPLHIVWHNLVSSNRELHEKILLYEPIQVEEIYAKLKSFGYKFHIQDIITFLDKKCITIRIAQNQKKSAGS